MIFLSEILAHAAFIDFIQMVQITYIPPVAFKLFLKDVSTRVGIRRRVCEHRTSGSVSFFLLWRFFATPLGVILIDVLVMLMIAPPPHPRGRFEFLDN